MPLNVAKYVPGKPPENIVQVCLYVTGRRYFKNNYYVGKPVRLAGDWWLVLICCERKNIVDWLV
jgi:hypothetical protein